MARRTLYGGLWKTVLVVLELINDIALRLNTEAADQGRDQVLRSESASAGFLAELEDDHALGVAWDAEVDADFDLINNLLHREFKREGVSPLSGAAIQGGIEVVSKVVLTGTVNYVIGGVQHSATDVEAVLQLGETTQAKYGAWRVMIDAQGVLSTQAATPNGTSGTMAFTTEEEALLSLCQIARTANTIDVGYLTILAASGGFTPQTDTPNDSSGAVDGHGYYTVTQPEIDNGLTAALGASVAIGSTATKYSVGSIDARTNGLEPAQVTGLTDVTFDDADTIADTKFGGWLIVTDLAKTGVYALASDGIADAVSAMTHASDAAVVTQLDVLREALPKVFTEVGHIRVQNAAGADPTTFTAATTALDGSEADISVIYTDRLSGAYDRTSLTQALAQSNAEAIPGAITAPLIATLTNTVVGSGGRVGVGMAVDGGSALDVQFDNAIYYQILGQTYFKDVDAAVDISTECAGTGDTVSAGLHGAMWMFVAADGSVDGENDKAAADYASAVLALAQYSIATNTLPVADHVPVGVIQVLESAGGGFTWGDDSITAETPTYYSFEGLPGIESAIASFALDAAAATVTYGAAVIVLGTGTRVTLTGKAALAFTGTTVVAVGKTGAYLLYALADDTEVLVTATSTANDLQAAKDVVRDLAPNPLMPLLGVIYVTARLNAFTPGTTNLDLNGVDTEFVTYGVTTNRQEHGRSSGSTFTPIDEVLHTSAPVGLARRP